MSKEELKTAIPSPSSGEARTDENCKWCGCSLPQGCTATCFANPNDFLCERSQSTPPAQNVDEPNREPPRDDTNAKAYAAISTPLESEVGREDKLTHLEMVERMMELCPALTFAVAANLTQRLIEGGYLHPQASSPAPSPEPSPYVHPLAAQVIAVDAMKMASRSGQPYVLSEVANLLTRLKNGDHGLETQVLLADAGLQQFLDKWADPELVKAAALGRVEGFEEACRYDADSQPRVEWVTASDYDIVLKLLASQKAPAGRSYEDGIRDAAEAAWSADCDCEGKQWQDDVRDAILALLPSSATPNESEVTE